jgi:hypothetical protein
MHRLFAALILLAVLQGCQNGDPLPTPSGPFEPLNGWNPDAGGAAAQTTPAEAGRS